MVQLMADVPSGLGLTPPLQGNNNKKKGFAKFRSLQISTTVLALQLAGRRRNRQLFLKLFSKQT
jgi:hypothetical protein